MIEGDELPAFVPWTEESWEAFVLQGATEGIPVLTPGVAVVNDNFDAMTRQVGREMRQEEEEMGQMLSDAIVESTTEITDVKDSVIAALGTVSNELQELVHEFDAGETDQALLVAKLKELADSLRSDADVISDAVVANTVAENEQPAVTAEPALGEIEKGDEEKKEE